MPLDAESLYAQLGRLVESMPALATEHPISPATQQWVGRAFALVEEMGDLVDISFFQSAANSLNSTLQARHAQTITAIVYRALAKAELQAPASGRGAFIPAGNAFDAFTAIGKVLTSATRDLLIVDPYMDEKALTDFAPLAPETATLRLLADQQSHKASLKPATDRWIAQFAGTRPLQVRLTAARTLHDRLIVVDGTVVWTLTQSINAFASRSPATIVRIDPETSALKVAAYDAIWQAATPI